MLPWVTVWRARYIIKSKRTLCIIQLPIWLELFNGVIAQFGRVSDLHSECPEFESLWLHKNVKSERLDEKSIAKETKGQPKVLHYYASWCNGSTTDFGSVRSGSSPDEATNTK